MATRLPDPFRTTIHEQEASEPVCAFCETCVVARPGEFCSPECQAADQDQPPTPAFESLDDLLLELASQVGGCRRDASDAIQRGLAIIAQQAGVARG